jgi:hypothetical protein
LTELAEAEARLDAHQQSQKTLSEQERNRLLEMGSNLNAAWNDVSTPVELKKRIIRTSWGIELGRTRRKNWYRREEFLSAENFGEMLVTNKIFC